jgi:hypothetical protein
LQIALRIPVTHELVERIVHQRTAHESGGGGVEAAASQLQL